ncbi:MAG: hypothetical protein M1836_000714 [Candelina mexicana]|nr:MAG: hypothetical protein M1836_000714 [Candelina mexicana]
MTTLLPIAQLTPSLSTLSQYSIRAVVTLIWPYSSSTRSLALLLAEPDFRLRRQKGQVRVNFTGSSAKAVARSGIGSGDEVVLALQGVIWDKGGTVNTPGKGVGYELEFRERMVMQISRDSQSLAFLDVNHPASSPVQSPTPPRSAAPPASLAGQLVNGKFASQNVWDSPAFFKRTRDISGSIFASAYDPFAHEDGFVEGKGRKRTKFGRESGGWTYADRTPSPEKDLEGSLSQVVDDHSGRPGSSGTADLAETITASRTQATAALAPGLESVGSREGGFQESFDGANTQDYGPVELELPVSDTVQDDSMPKAIARGRPPQDTSVDEALELHSSLAEHHSTNNETEENTKNKRPTSPTSTVPLTRDMQPSLDALHEALSPADQEALPSVSAPTPPVLQVNTTINDNGLGMDIIGSESHDIPDSPRLQPVDSAIMPQVSPLTDRKGKLISYVSADYEDQHEHYHEKSPLEERSETQEFYGNSEIHRVGSTSREHPAADLPDRQEVEYLSASAGETISFLEIGLQRPKSMEPEHGVSHDVGLRGVLRRHSSFFGMRRTEALIPSSSAAPHSNLVSDADDEDAADKMVGEAADEIADEMADKMADKTVDEMADEMADDMADEMPDDDSEETSNVSVEDATDVDNGDVFQAPYEPAPDELSNNSEMEDPGEVVHVIKSDDEEALESVHEDPVSDNDVAQSSEDDEVLEFEMVSSVEDDQVGKAHPGNIIDLTGQGLSDETESEEELEEPEESESLEESEVDELEAKNYWPGVQDLLQMDGSDDTSPTIKGKNVKSEEFSDIHSVLGVPDQINSVRDQVMRPELETYAKLGKEGSVVNAFDDVREIADSYDDENDEFSDVDSMLDVANDSLQIHHEASTISPTAVPEDNSRFIKAVTEEKTDILGTVNGNGVLPVTKTKESTVVVIDLEDEPSSDLQAPVSSVEEQGIADDENYEDKHGNHDPSVDRAIEQEDQPPSSSAYEERNPIDINMHNTDELDTWEKVPVHPSSPPPDVDEDLPSSPPILPREDQQDPRPAETVNTQLITPQATQQMLVTSQHLTADQVEPASPDPVISRVPSDVLPPPFTPQSHKFVRDKLEEARALFFEDKPSPFTPRSHRFVRQRLEEARRSLARARLEHPSSDVPEVISPWFAPRKPVQPAKEEEATPPSSPSSEPSDSETEQSKALMKPTESLTLPPPNHEIPVTYTQNGNSISSSISFLTPPPTGLRTPLAYYAPFSTLSTLYNTTTSIVAIASASTPIIRAKTGPRDYHTTIHITDPSSSPTTTKVQIFRPFKEALPLIGSGDAILLRNFKMVSFERKLGLVSQANSAWAVLKGREIDVGGPPVELGAEERGFAKGLGEWWGSLGERVREEILAGGRGKEMKRREDGSGRKGKGAKLLGES